MKRTLPLVLALAIGGATGAVLVSRQSAARHSARLALLQTAWQQEKAGLEAALESAKGVERVVTVPAPASPHPTVHAASPTPAEWIARLRALSSGPGPVQARITRQAIHHLEELVAAGPAALPAIREFLARHEDLDFVALQARGARRGVPEDSVVPPSLRFGLFDVVKRIGGPDAEKLLADTLGTTGRGVEVAWLSRALQELAPDKYQEAALAAARELLARPSPGKADSSLDFNDREHLFGVLAMYGDTSYVNAAQGQLVQADGAVDRSALKYLQQSLGPQAVPLAAQAYQNPLLLTNAAAKEPLARLALNFVGSDAQANELYLQAINDPVLTKGHRKNLIEDLNQDGFPDTKNLSARDLPLIQSRLDLIDRLAPDASDPVNIAAFKEARKDLLNMRERITHPPAPVQ